MPKVNAKEAIVKAVVVTAITTILLAFNTEETALPLHLDMVPMAAKVIARKQKAVAEEEETIMYFKINKL